MQQETKQLVQALSAINHKVPDVGLALLEGQISPDNQRQFAWLLLEVAELLIAHASAGERPVVDGEAITKHLREP